MIKKSNSQKIWFSCLAFVLSLGLVACNSETELDKAAKVAIKAMQSILDNDTKTFMANIYMQEEIPANEKEMFDEKIKAMVAESSKKAKKEVETKGGFDKFEVTSQEFAKNKDGTEDQNKAIIKLVTKYKNGTSGKEISYTVLKDSKGQWKLDFK